MATINLTAEQFKSDVFDYTTSKEWKYKDEVPAIIDFYADWCGPCFGFRSIPSMLFIPVGEKEPKMQAGALNNYEC